jgi:hypothetical protein
MDTERKQLSTDSATQKPTTRSTLPTSMPYLVRNVEPRCAASVSQR